MAIAAAEREAVNETEAAVSRVEDLLHSVEERTLALGEALSVLGPRDGGRRPAAARASSRATATSTAPRSPGCPAPAGSTAPSTTTGRRRARAASRPPTWPREAYRYWERDWFREPLAAGGPALDRALPGRGRGEASMVTFAVPFSGAGGAPAGVVTADVRLRRLDSIVEGDRAGPERLRARALARRAS